MKQKNEIETLIKECQEKHALEMKNASGYDKLQMWWSLSYCQYLTIPRAVMQEMPDEWQGKMAALLEELDDTLDWRPKEGRYWVRLKDDNGRFAEDPYWNYRHPKKIPRKEKS